MTKVQKSRSKRIVFKKAPSGEVRIHYHKRKPARAKCAECGKILSGVPSERPYKMTKMAKSKKRPQRPDGGQLCSGCSRKRIIKKAREHIW